MAEIPHGAVSSSNSDFSIALRAENMSIVHRGGVEVYSIYKIKEEKRIIILFISEKADKIFLYRPGFIFYIQREIQKNREEIDT